MAVDAAGGAAGAGAGLTGAAGVDESVGWLMATAYEMARRRVARRSARPGHLTCHVRRPGRMLPKIADGDADREGGRESPMATQIANGDVPRKWGGPAGQ